VAKKIRWTPASADDLQAISDYIANDSPHYADLVIEHIIEAVERAAQFPGIGRVVPETDRLEVREVRAYDYRAIYRVESHHIVVLAVVHGARDLLAALRNRRV
jgi:toxin ParE1/3/4